MANPGRTGSPSRTDKAQAKRCITRHISHAMPHDACPMSCCNVGSCVCAFHVRCCMRRVPAQLSPTLSVGIGADDANSGGSSLSANVLISHPTANMVRPVPVQRWQGCAQRWQQCVSKAVLLRWYVVSNVHRYLTNQTESWLCTSISAACTGPITVFGHWRISTGPAVTARMALRTTYRRCLLACRLGTAVGALACNGMVLSSACAFWRELHSPSAEPAVPRTACTLEHPTARCWRKEAAACSVRTACARRARSRHHSAFCTPARSSGPRACRARTPPPSSSTSSLVTILPLGAHAFLRAHCVAHAGVWGSARIWRSHVGVSGGRAVMCTRRCTPRQVAHCFAPRQSCRLSSHSGLRTRHSTCAVHARAAHMSRALAAPGRF